MTDKNVLFIFHYFTLSFSLFNHKNNIVEINNYMEVLIRVFRKAKIWFFFFFFINENKF
jgi:hypothetical protein